MTRSALVIALGLLLLAPSAAAGGGWWSYIEVTHAPVAAGQRVEVKASVLFNSAADAEAAQQPGRYRVYLLQGFDDSALERAMRKASPGDWWSLGAAEAIEVGPVAVDPADANFGTATAAFTVPELAAGAYHVMLCNPGCAEPLADVIPTAGFTVVGDPATAQLAKRVARLERRSRKQARELAALRDEAYEALVTARDARSKTEDLQVRLASPANEEPSSSVWWVVGALGGSLALLVLRRLVHFPMGIRPDLVNDGEVDPVDGQARRDQRRPVTEVEHIGLSAVGVYEPAGGGERD
jgi:hypothetical protein